MNQSILETTTISVFKRSNKLPFPYFKCFKERSIKAGKHTMPADSKHQAKWHLRQEASLSYPPLSVCPDRPLAPWEHLLFPGAGKIKAKKLKWLQNPVDFHLIPTLPCRWGFVFIFVLIYGVTLQLTNWKCADGHLCSAPSHANTNDFDLWQHCLAFWNTKGNPTWLFMQEQKTIKSQHLLPELLVNEITC